MERKSMEEINREGEKKVSCAHGYVEWPVTVRGRRRNWKGAWLADALHEPSITGIQSASRQKGGEWWEEEEKKKSQMARESYNRLKASDIAHGWEPSSLFPSEKYKSPGFLCSHVASSTGPLSHTRGGMTRCDWNVWRGSPFGLVSHHRISHPFQKEKRQEKGKCFFLLFWPTWQEQKRRVLFRQQLNSLTFPTSIIARSMGPCSHLGSAPTILASRLFSFFSFFILFHP